MKALAVVLSLTFATSVFGQAVHRNFGSVVFPGGTTSPSTGITRNFGSVVFPGGDADPARVWRRPGRQSAPWSWPGNPGTSGWGSAPEHPAADWEWTGTGMGLAAVTSLVTPYVYAYPVYIGGGTTTPLLPRNHTDLRTSRSSRSPTSR